MTIEEKISFLSQVKIILLDNNSWLDGTKEPIKESFDTAIKSLEAWEKVRAEIQTLRGCSCSYSDGIIDDIEDIIDKYRGVSE